MVRSMTSKKNKSTVSENLQIQKGRAALEMLWQDAGTAIDTFAAVYGRALCGERCAAAVSAAELKDQIGLLYEATQSPVAFTLLVSDADNTFETIADLPALRACAQFYAYDVQSLIDLTILAQKTAERALVPALVVYNPTYITGSYQSYNRLSSQDVQAFLGAADDLIAAPTPSQEMQFGKQRRRLPRLISMENPIGIHANFEQGMEAQKTAAARHYFRDGHIGTLLDASCIEFANLSGRDYRLPAPDGISKHLIFCYGVNVPVLETLCTLSDRQLKIHSRIINLSIINPLPQKQIALWFYDIKRGVVLSPSSAGESALIFEQIYSVRQKMLENSLNRQNDATESDFGVFKNSRSLPELKNIFIPSGLLDVKQVQNLFAVLAGQDTNTEKFSGLDFNADMARYPLLDNLQRKLQTVYPFMKKGPSSHNPDINTGIKEKSINIQWLATRAHDLNVFGPWLISLTTHKASYVNTYLENRRNAYMPYQRFTLNSSPTGKPTPFAPVNTMLAIDSRYLNELDTLAEEGVLCVASPFKDLNFWQKLTDKNRQIIKEKKIGLFVIDVAALTQAAPVTPAQRNALQMTALLGAFCAGQSNDEVSNYPRRFEKIIKQQADIPKSMAAQMVLIFKNAMENCHKIEWDSLPEFSALKQKPDTAPWAYRNLTIHDNTIFDAARFYDTVGYLYKEEQPQLATADPFLASGSIPASSSSIRDLSPTHTYIPKLLAENCTGCGICWSQCPESALPSTLQEPASLLETAMSMAAETGFTFMQMGRVNGHIAKLADKLLKGAQNGVYLHADVLMLEAFEQLIPKLKPDAATEETLRSEFKTLSIYLKNFPLIKSAFFEPKILSITVNPNACKGCSLCINSCPEDALERSEVHTEIIADYKNRFELMTRLPGPSIEMLDSFIKSDDQETFRMLDKHSYFTMVGGDNSSSGSGIKSALHQMLSAINSAQQQKRNLLLREIDSLISQLQDRIQGKLSSSVKINSFDDFHQRLNTLNSGASGSDALLKLSGDTQKNIDTAQLKYLAGLIDELQQEKSALSKGRSGNGAATMSLVFQTGPLLDWMAAYPYNPFNMPWVESSATEIARTASGIFDGLAKHTLQLVGLLRQTRESLSSADDVKRPQLAWADLNAEEKGYAPTVVTILDSQSLSRQSLGSFAEILSGDKPILLNALNVSGASAAMGQPAMWALSLQSGSVLQASPAYPGHLIKNIRHIIHTNRPAFIHLDASDPYLHGIGEDQAYRHELRAVDTRRFPLFSYDPQKSDFFTGCFDLSANPSIEDAWHPVVFHEGVTIPPRKVTYPLTPADWAIYDNRFSSEFQNIPANEIKDDIWTALSDYLNPDAGEQTRKRPYIRLALNASMLYFSVSPLVIDLCRAHQQEWKILQELAGIRGAGMEYLQQKMQTEQTRALDDQKARLENEYNQTLQQVQDGQMQLHQQKLTEKLKALYNAGKKQQLTEMTNE